MFSARRPVFSSPAPRTLLSAAAAALVGCSGDVTLSDSQATPAPSLDELYPEFIGATLVVHEPAPAEVLIVEDGQRVEGEVLDASGEPLDWDGIVWTTSEADEPFHTGNSGDVELDSGIHDITATAELPNGDRLQWTLGGVRVQGRQTGVYAGSMNLTLAGEFQGTPISAACVGALDFVVPMSGDTMEGGGGCTLALPIVGTFDVTYAVAGDIDDPDVVGTVALDLGFLDYPLDWEGGFEDEGVLGAEYGGTLNLFVTEVQMDGVIDAHRVTQYVDE